MGLPFFFLAAAGLLFNRCVELCTGNEQNQKLFSLHIVLVHLSGNKSFWEEKQRAS